MVILTFCFPKGIDEISEDVYKSVEHSDSEESDKSDSSDSEYASDDERKPKEAPAGDKNQKEPCLSKAIEPSSPSKDQESSPDINTAVASKSAANISSPTAPEEPTKDRPQGAGGDKKSPERTKVASPAPVSQEKPQVKEQAPRFVPVEDSDSERELVIDLGEEQVGKEKKRVRKNNSLAKSTPAKVEGKRGHSNFVYLEEKTLKRVHG